MKSRLFIKLFGKRIVNVCKGDGLESNEIQSLLNLDPSINLTYHLNAMAKNKLIIKHNFSRSRILWETKKETIEITRDQLSTICRVFHKWFRVADCKNYADVDMYNAINKLDDKEYVLAMTDSLGEAGIEIEKEKDETK